MKVYILSDIGCLSDYIWHVTPLETCLFFCKPLAIRTTHIHYHATLVPPKPLYLLYSLAKVHGLNTHSCRMLFLDQGSVRPLFSYWNMQRKTHDVLHRLVHPSCQWESMFSHNHSSRSGNRLSADRVHQESHQTMICYHCQSQPTWSQS